MSMPPLRTTMAGGVARRRPGAASAGGAIRPAATASGKWQRPRCRRSVDGWGGCTPNHAPGVRGRKRGGGERGGPGGYGQLSARLEAGDVVTTAARIEAFSVDFAVRSA